MLRQAARQDKACVEAAEADISGEADVTDILEGFGRGGFHAGPIFRLATGGGEQGDILLRKIDVRLGGRLVMQLFHFPSRGQRPDCR